MQDIENKKMSGQIEVICGSMFSGKTEELIRRLRRAQIAKQKVEIFKPKIDNRYSENEIVSHSDQKIPSTVVETAEQILLLKKYKDTIKSLDDRKKDNVYCFVEALEKLLLSSSVRYSIYLKAIKDYHAAISQLSAYSISLLNKVFSD